MVLPDADSQPAKLIPGTLRRPALQLIRPRALLLGSICLAAAMAGGGVVGQVSPTPAAPAETEEGIPVTDALTVEKCGTCHAPDAKGNLSRISWLRTTPEGWSQAIKRMVKLNGLSITPAESRDVVRYLATKHGLAPEEAKPVMYLPEHRMVTETNIPSESLRGACAACHSFAQPLSWRRSAREWKLLQDMHVALYSQADVQYRRPATDEPGAVFGQPTPIVQKPDVLPITQGQVALDYMRKVAPLRTPEWTRWAAQMQTPRLAGKWLVNAFIPGKGSWLGTMNVTPGATPASFNTAVTLRSLADGSVLTRSGSGVVYAGYSWRGRSSGPAAASADAVDSTTRETMWFAPDRRSAQGRWFWGAYQEFGIDVKLVRADGAPVIAAVTPAAIRAGSKAVQVHIHGDALPGTPKPADIDLGAGVRVTRIVSASPSEIVVIADAATDAVPGAHDVTVGSAVLSGGLPVYRRIDYVKVTPETALTRLGGAKIAKGYGQFDAWGFDNGPDGKPHTADDINIGTIPANWSMQEFQTTWFDDDVGFVGTLSPAGLFTPNLDGPNPQRSNNRNNYGEVWVVATARDAKTPQGKPLVGKAHMVVTVPAYRRWDNPEVAE